LLGTKNMRHAIAEPLDLDGASWPFLLQVEKAEATWQRRRPRRIAVRILGWTAVIGALWGAAEISNVPPARAAMLNWATLGAPREATAAAWRARSLLDALVLRFWRDGRDGADDGRGNAR
jgi:hypothetical protein